ncbi:MAG: phosphatidylglycerol lysyltransferase domain-containing protein [Cetobacterium sp.]
MEIIERKSEMILKCIDLSSNENAFLAFLEDKKYFFYPNEINPECFIMYGVKSSSYIAMGDPIGDEKSFQKCIQSFQNFCKSEKKKCIFYEVDHKNIGDYIKNNMIVSKVGERGKIDLDKFTLSGSNMSKLRYTYTHCKKNNYIFKIIKKEDSDSILNELEEVSNEWLKMKKSSEKKFSVGYFEKKYIKKFDIAIVQKNDKIIAFANLYKTIYKECLTLDLMRHRENLENGVMEFFFTSLILYSKDEMYKKFSLGIVPLSGIEKSKLSPYKYCENFIFNHEKHFYNFKGLKMFKDKFKPEWEPVYIAYYGHLILPLVLKNIVSLSSGGLIRVIKKIKIKR